MFTLHKKKTQQQQNTNLLHFLFLFIRYMHNIVYLCTFVYV